MQNGVGSVTPSYEIDGTSSDGLSREVTPTNVVSQVAAPTPLKRKSTILLEQQAVISKLSFASRVLGLVIAFLSIVGLWEGIDELVLTFARKNPVLPYSLLMNIGFVAVALSAWIMHHNMETHSQVLMTQGLLVLSTLALAVGTWGWIATCIDVYVDDEYHHWIYILGGLISFLCSGLYSLYTQHFALLDIASCVTSIGLLDIDDEIEEAEPLKHQEQIVKKLNFPSKIVGLTVAFLAVVGLWEGMSRSVRYCASGWPVLAYAIMTFLGFALVVHSTLYVRARLTTSEPTFLAQNYLVVSTIWSAAGTWGLIINSVNRYVPQSSRAWVYLLGGCIFFITSLIYSACTEHFALLDVVSCVTSLGLVEDELEDDGSESVQGTFSSQNCRRHRKAKDMLGKSMKQNSLR